MTKLKKIMLLPLLAFSTASIVASDFTQPTIEELRIEKARQAMPAVVEQFKVELSEFEQALQITKDKPALATLIEQHSQSLWRGAVALSASQQQFDDRGLYWARLQSSSLLRQSAVFKSLSTEQQGELLWQLELVSRGSHDIQFDKGTDKKILLTGFDPFFLDRNIHQSNPSGVVALEMDNKVIQQDGLSVEIEALIVPVRFEDFDMGMIETLLTPYLKNQSVDMLVTVSMGRDDFDLERFPGLRRSAEAPDNLNVLTGATAANPLVPLLNNQPLEGPEFNEFSLPAALMVKASGDFLIHDNHKVTTTEKSFSPETLADLAQQVAVQGSGGGYLSNEISYRSLLLRDKYFPTLPVGHIHTPRFKGFEPQKSAKIVKQVKSMLALAIPVL